VGRAISSNDEPRESAVIGRFSFVLTPFFRWLLERWYDTTVRKIVCRKSAQIGWTQSVICNVLGFIVHVEKTHRHRDVPEGGRGAELRPGEVRPDDRGDA
jgi:hypothetical protein